MRSHIRTRRSVRPYVRTRRSVRPYVRTRRSVRTFERVDAFAKNKQKYYVIFLLTRIFSTRLLPKN